MEEPRDLVTKYVKKVRQSGGSFVITLPKWWVGKRKEFLMEVFPDRIVIRKVFRKNEIGGDE
jgi:hypothetical protein